MTAAATTNLPRPAVSARTVLVDTAAVRAARGISTEKVHQLVEAGQLVWCWDISETYQQRPGRSHIRTLRFWAAEVWPIADVARLKLEEVLDRILPRSRKSYGWGELGQMLLISDPKIASISRMTGGRVENRTLKISREALAAFLRTRWIGATVQ